MSEFYFKAGGRTASPQLSVLAPAAAKKHPSRPPSPSPKDLPFPPNLSYSLVSSRTSSQNVHTTCHPQFPPDLSYPLVFSRILLHNPRRTSTRPAAAPQFPPNLSYSLVSSRTSPPKRPHPPSFSRISRILSCPLAHVPQHVHPTPAPFPNTKLLALAFAFCYTANCRDRPQETTGWRYRFSNAARGACRRSFPTFSEP